MSYDFSQMSDEELERELRMARGGGVPETEAERPASPYMEIARQELPAEEIRRRQEAFVEDRSNRESQMKEQLRYVIDNTKEEKEREQAAKWLASLETDNTLDWDDESMARAEVNVGGLHRAVADRRGHFEKFVDSLVRGHNQNATSIAAAADFLSGDPNEKERSQLLRAYRSVGEQYDAANPRGSKSGTFSDAVENGAGAVLDYVLESAGENAERMAIGTAAAILGGAAGGAAGAMAGSGVGSLALNAGEAAMNQIEDSVKEGLPLSRGWLAAEAGMYSAIEGAFGIEAGMGKVAVKMGLRKAAGDAAIEGLKAAGKMATAKGAAKTALKGALGEGVEEVLQDAGADRARLLGQTGSPLRKAETVEDAFKQAGESFAGGFAAAILTGGVGAAANHANARRVVGIHNRVVDAVGGDSAFKELAPDKQLLVARRLMNDSMLATDGVIDAEYRSLLERQNEAIDAELGRENADGETRAANAVLRGFDLAFAKEDMASVVEDMKANGSYKKRTDFKAMHDSRKDIGELPDGKTTGILYTDPATKQALVERHDKKTGRIVDFVVVNNGGLKDSLTGGDALHTRSLDKALAAMDDLANYNAYRAKKSEAKREVVKRMFDRLYGKRGAKLVVADSLASLKDFAVRDKFAVEMEKSGLPPVAAYDDKTDAVYVLADQTKTIGQLYTVLAHERAHKDIADAILGKPVEQGGATDEEHEAIAAGRERLFGSMRGGAERGEEAVVERASVDAIVKALDRSNRSAVDAAVRKALDLIRGKINEETGIALDAIADADAKNELRFLVKQGYLGKEAEVQLEAQEDTEAERMADQFAVESGQMTEDERKRREAEREAVAAKARGKAERKAAGEAAARVIAEDGMGETVPPTTAAQEERIAARKEDFEAALEDAEAKKTQTTGENDETGNGADEAPAHEGVGSGEAAQRTTEDETQTGAQRAQGTESAGAVERQTAQNAASANAEAPGARPAAETGKTTLAALRGVEAPSRASGAQGAKPAAKRKPRQKQNFKNFSITAYDEDARSGSNGLLRIARGRGGIWRIPVDMSRTTPGGKVHFTNDDADVTDYIKSLLADYGGLYMSKAGKLYLKNNKGGKGRMPSELRYLFGETFKPGHNDNYIAETLAEELGYVPENLEPSDLYSMLDKDLRNYKAWRQAKARGEAWETEDERAEREHYEAADAEEDAYYLDQAEMKAEADAEYDNALAEVLEYDGTPTVRMFGKSQMKSLKGGETIYFDHDGIDWVVVGYDAKNDILTVKEPQEVAESRVWAEGGDTTRATPKMIKYAVTEDGFSKIGESEEEDGRETQGESYQDGDGDAAGAARGAQAGGRQGTGGTEQRTFALESAAADEIKREEKSRAAKAQLEKKASAPLKGSAGEVGQSLLDLGGEEGEDLFNRTARTEEKKAEATQSEELPQGIERRANGYAVRGNVYRSVEAAQKALEKERAVFRQGDTVTLEQDGERVTGTVNRAPDGSLSVRVREPGRNRYESAKVRDVKVKDRKNLTKLIDGGTRWKRANVADFDKANGTEVAAIVELSDALSSNDTVTIAKYARRYPTLARTSDFLKSVGIIGEKFTIGSNAIKRHHGKDGLHVITSAEWMDISKSLSSGRPLGVTRYYDPQKRRIIPNAYRIWTRAFIGERPAIVGVEVKSNMRDLFVNSVDTVFALDEATIKKETLVYPNSVEELRSVLADQSRQRYTEAPQDADIVSQDATGSQGGAKTMFKRSGIYTGSVADYANRSRQGGVDDGPSLKKIGTGEGSQVYGWGLYGSTVRGVAEGYAKDAREYNAEKNGKRIDLIFPENMLEAETAKRLMENGGDVRKTIEKLKLKGIGSAIIKELEEHGAEYSVAPKHEQLYEQTFFTDRATSDESHLLKWYEPVTSKQRKWVLDALEKENLAGESNLKRIRTEKMTGRQLYELLSGMINIGDEKAASEFLARAGIDGVKYPVDSYGGKGVKDGDEVGWNYVSFRDDNIRVDHKWTDGQMRYKIAGTRQSKKPGDEGYLTIARYDMEDSGEYHDIDAILSEFDGDIASGRKTRFWQKIPADEYQAALRKFMREGELFDYPESKLRDWLNRMIGNTMDLEVLTTLFSHSEYDPKGEVGEHYNRDFDKSDYSDFLEAKGFDEWGRLPDGSKAISDYGLRPLYGIFNELPSNPTPAEMMVAINRALDVVHARGDLASMFIEGGSKRLSQISNDMTSDIRFKRASADDTDYYFGAKESFDAHGRETYTAKDLGISTTDEAVLAAAHRYARDFRRVKQLMDDAILGRERTYTPVDVATLTVKHRDLQHDLTDVLRRMESTGNPDEFQAEKELIEAQLDNVARASSIIGTKTGQTLRAFRIGISDDIRDSEAYILQSMRVNKQRKGLGSELTDEEVAKAKQMVEQLKAENEKLKAQIAELEANRKKNLKTQVEATNRPKRTAARKAAKTPSTEQRKKDFAKKYGHNVSDSGAKAWNLLARLSGKTAAMFKGGKGAALTPEMMDAFAQIVEDMDGDYETAASAIKDTLPDMAGAFAQFRSSMEKRDKSDLSTLADNFRKVVVPKHGLAELAQPITDQRLVTTKDLAGAREKCKRQLDENEGNPRKQRIALGHYLRRYRDALINENPDIPQDELNEKMAAEATALTGTKHDAMAMLAVEAGVDGYDLETRAEIQRKIAKAQRALDLFRAGKINEAARESGLLYEDEATALAEMEATLQQLMQEKADEIDYLGTLSEKNKEAVERVKQLKEEIKEMNSVLHLMRKEAGMAEKKAKYAEMLEKRLAEAQRNADNLLGEIDSDEFKERKAKAEAKVAELKAALAVAKRDEDTLKKIKDRIAELEKRIADGDYDRQLLQIRANDAELQAKIRMQRERRNALRRKLDEERRRMKYREMGIVGKTWEGVKGILGEMKSVVASFDLSSVLRQGGQLTWAHPFIAAKNLKETLKAFKSEEYSDKLMAQLRMRPNWQYYEKAGIDFTDWGENAANKEDVYLLNQYRKITNMKFIKSGVQMSERAFSTFLNLMRADVFDAMAAGSTFGSAANMNDSQLKAMGRFINIASQRGAFEKGGKFANAIPLLNVVLWSPRNMASRFQFLGESATLLMGGAAYGDKTMRRLFAKELVRYIGGMSAAAMFLKAMAELFRDDDDPPNDMEFDPRSSDFLKVRFGNIRIDMTSGLTPIIVFASRMLSGETKNLRGQVRESNRHELVGRFIRQKFAPGASLVYDIGIAREDFERRDIDWTSLWEKDAEHVSAYRYLFGSFMPLTGADLLEQAQIGGLPKTFVTGFLSTLGANVQAFDPYNFKQMKGDYTYFRGLYDKAMDPEEKRHLLEYHPMLKRRDRIEAALKRVRDLDKIRKNAEKSGQSRPDLDERIKEAKQKAVDAIAGF